MTLDDLIAWASEARRHVGAGAQVCVLPYGADAHVIDGPHVIGAVADGEAQLVIGAVGDEPVDDPATGEPTWEIYVGRTHLRAVR